MVIIKDIDIINFGSIKSLFYLWDSQGINLIQGKNGSGKSTLISALCWGLFGKSLKNSIVSWNSKEGTKVTINLEIGKSKVTIIRCKDYTKKVNGTRGGNRTYLLVDGKIQTNRDKSDIQEAINKLLGVSFKLFKNSTVFGQKLTRLLQESGPNQKKIFDEAFNVDFINLARTNAMVELEKLSNLISDKQAKLNLAKEKLSSARAAYVRSRQVITFFERSKLDRINAAKKAIEGLAIENPPQRLKFDPKLILGKVKNMEREEFKLDFSNSNDEAELKGLKNQLKKLIVSPSQSKTCSLCLQEMNQKHRQIHAQNILKSKIEISKSIEEKNKALVKNKIDHEHIRNRLTILKRKAKLSEEFVRQSDRYQKYLLLLKNLRKEIDLVEAEKAPDIDIQSDKLKYLKSREVYRELKIEVKKLSIPKKDHEWVVDQALSNKGLKTYVFNSLLSLVNKNLKVYANILGFNVYFSIDLESKIKNFKAFIVKGDNQIDYNDLSGGEQQLVDICLAFSIHDVISAKTDFNILVLDEVFESLDEDNIEQVSELIVEKSKTKSVHLVHHNSNFIVPSIKQTIILKKINGCSVISR